MDTYQETPLWDLGSSFSQLPDDDFLALLQKQFPTTGDANQYNFNDSVNPQSISRYSLPSLTPPSEDSSPSPPQFQDTNDDYNDPALKRKASDEDFDEAGPSQKNQHILDADKKPASGPMRRKSGTGKDETRLMKRKEQNRAAQRAFRERKEKHVKDLEDKVAALEAKNEQAVNENENLRDLLSRLQNENLMLKQSPFTFAVPKPSPANAVDQSRKQFGSDVGFTPSTASSPPLAKTSNLLDWSSLTSFDPVILEDSPQPTATDGAMKMDFGFGGNLGNTGLTSNAPYKAIASNPMFMSFAATFDSFSQPNDDSSSNTTNNDSFNFDMSSVSTWSSPSSQTQDRPNALDDLFSGFGNSAVDYSFMNASRASASPVAHTNGPQNNELSGASASSSPSSIASDPLFGSNAGTHSSNSDSELLHDENTCPKTKSELQQRIVQSGLSPFAPTNAVRKSSDQSFGSMIACSGSTLPKTQQSDRNIEVLSAWRSITSNPKFKDVDMNNLCNEFASKARCDGTKVVLEPQGVHSIMENLSKK